VDDAAWGVRSVVILILAAGICSSDLLLAEEDGEGGEMGGYIDHQRLGFRTSHRVVGRTNTYHRNGLPYVPANEQLYETSSRASNHRMRLNVTFEGVRDTATLVDTLAHDLSAGRDLAMHAVG
jgi:hypothetical protein